ncbi:hypothetical protein ACHQM5_011368 [Ranunculus cassubicifolius]
MDVKVHKLLKQDNMSIDKDRISKLPDTILFIILSFLTMKDVVATSIVSTKWRYLWQSVPSLDFSNYTRSMNAVDKVLFFRDTLSNITKFSLLCNSEWDGYRVNAWISVVVMHKLQELILTIRIKESSILPPSLFSCESLTVLKLLYDGVVRVPSSISLPSLKILELKYIHFADGHLTENFSSCPVLEELIISNCRWVNISRKLFISNPALKRLVIECPNLDEGIVDFIMIEAPSLVFFRFASRYLPIECNMSVMSSLASASVIIQQCYQDKPKEEIGLVASNILGALSNVKYLKISAQILSRAKDFSDNFPEFGNLLDLEVDKGCDYMTTSSLLLLPQVSPHLETILFKGPYLHYGTEEENWTLNLVPHLCLLHLKKVEYCDFAGDSVEIVLVKYLVENATVLEEIIIHVNWELSKGRKCRVFEQLLKARRASNRCIIDIR